MPAVEHLYLRTGVVVVAHGRADLALRCLETLRPNLAADRMVAVVNAPELAAPGDLEALHAIAHVESPVRPQGYAANLNLGVRCLPDGTDYLLLANDDVEFDEGGLGALIEKIDASPTVGAVGPAFRDRRGGVVEPERGEPSPRAYALYSARLLPLGRLWSLLERVTGADTPAGTATAGAPAWLSGAVMLVRAAAFRSIGGFDEDFFLYYEETDFCFRLREAGWRVVYADDVSVVHLGGESTQSRYERAFLQSRRLYFEKRLGRPRFLFLQATLLTVFVVGSAYNLAAAALRPRTARRRMELVTSLWRRRLFLLGRRVQA